MACRDASQQMRGVSLVRWGGTKMPCSSTPQVWGLNEVFLMRRHPPRWHQRCIAQDQVGLGEIGENKVEVEGQMM